jgi:uncharacterized protein with FMN-binding domain
MRRIVLGLLGTLVGTAIMIGFKAHGVPLDGTVAATGPADPSNGTGAPAGPGGPGPANGQPAPGASGGPTPTGAPGPSASGGPAPSGHPTTTTTTTTTTQGRTITGTAVAARTAKTPNCGECSGNMQVRIVVTGTHIDSITTIQQSNRPLGTANTLRQQALSAQSANVGNITGATYSALAWKQSLQSAINQI